MIFEVARSFHFLRVDVALEFFKKQFGGLAKYVDEHVDTAAVRHANHEFLQSRAAADLNQLVEHRNQALTAFEGESLLPNVAGVQVAFDALGSRQLPEQPASLSFAEHIAHHAVLEAFA